MSAERVITAEMISGLKTLQVSIKGRRVSGLSRTFHDTTQQAASSGSSYGSNELVALLGSNGFLEVACPDGSAAALLGVGVGEPVRVVAKP